MLSVARRGRSSMVERQLPKLHTRVRFPSPAPFDLTDPRFLFVLRAYARGGSIPFARSILCLTRAKRAPTGGAGAGSLCSPRLRPEVYGSIFSLALR